MASALGQVLPGVPVATPMSGAAKALRRLGVRKLVWSPPTARHSTNSSQAILTPLAYASQSCASGCLGPRRTGEGVAGES